MALNLLQNLLQKQQQLRMTPSPIRSALVQQLLQQAAQPRGSMSPIESINNASKPILAALLGRQEGRAQETQSAREQVNLQQMMAALQRGDTEMASGIAGSMQNNPMAQLLMQSVIEKRFAGQGGDPFTLSPGQVRFDASGNQLATLPDEQDPEHPDQVNIRVAGTNGTSDIFAANIDPMTGVATAKDRSYQPGEYQRVSTSIQGTPDEVFPTEGERRVGLGSRLLLSLEDAANDALNNNPEFDPTALFEARGETPLVGNILASPGFQQFRAAADEWTANMVYLRSGTTARQDEKDSAFQNFWYRVGDDQQTMPFKERLRLEAMREAYIAGSRANRIGSEEANQVLAEIDRKLAALQQGGQPRVIDLNDLPE